MVVKSPLTNCGNVTLLNKFSREKIISDWQDFFQIDVSADLKAYPAFQLYRCNITDLRFFYPLDIFGSAQLYENLMKFEWYYMAEKWEYQVALQDLQENSRILEIGCGHGHFVRQAENKGFQIGGIDSNQKAVLNAQKNGLNIRQLSVPDILVEGKSQYDCLCAFQVLEHLPNPLKFLTDCIDLLKSNGLLLLSVPNANSFLKYQYNLLDMPPHHMTQWSVKSFRALEKLLPLKLEAARYEPLADYHITGYVQTKENRLKGVLSRLPNSLTGLIINNYEKALRRGLNRYTRGQSLYVKLRKQK
ncbi:MULTISPECIES: class I SAM-dependent methyltransferase [Cyanophyceae]|uniref:class I SAM-dependent methyltransferase n=1 Tax=Cyanophyceae TaxID=3028117 RepID=UPI001688F4A3|nr:MULTISPECIES: class I SAM-dependent methyltransferase [Cyanophyceae]MBD1914960.1 methyltransferase domain-containing protein [Phormidium sp. FACHB-77]MBD2049892.1 methyltransferase domain-containing protein [Leptolyngbya sp. FACHB-60]